MFTARWRCQTISFNNKIWIIGGALTSSGANYKDLWTSINCIESVDIFPVSYSVKRGQQTVLYNNSIFVIGGNTATSAAGSTPLLLNEIWKYDF